MGCFADLFGTQSYVYELSAGGRFRSTGLVEAVFRELYDNEVREGTGVEGGVMM